MKGIRYGSYGKPFIDQVLKQQS